MTQSILRDSSVSKKVDTLLSRMTLDQKIGQMTLAERQSVSPEDVTHFHLGGVFSGCGSCPGNNLLEDWVEMTDAYWLASMKQDENHLAIPVIYAVDAIHGNCNVEGAVLFPHNIGLGATGDPDLIQKIARVTAREVLCAGVDWGFAPCLAVAEDIHWGRTYESFSEDPATVAVFGGEFVKGLQWEFGRDGVIASVKHWVGDGGTAYGIDQGDTTLSLEALEKTHIAPYYKAIEAGVLTVMVSFSSWNGDKCHAHRYLLTDVLKNKMQFQGLIVSDFDGIDYLSEDYHEAVAMAVNAGIDMFMISESWQEFITLVKRHVRRGTIGMKRIDDAVRRILGVKFVSGLFDKPQPAKRHWSNHDSFGDGSHRALAREAVRKSLVLLKNENSILPLPKDVRLFVAGRSAHNRGHLCGGFSLGLQGHCGNEHMSDATSVWEGIRKVSSQAELSATGDGSDADPDRHNVAIVVIGECPYAEGHGDVRIDDHVIVEAGSQIKGSINVLQPYGKTLELAKLHPGDLQTIRNITSRGIPVVVVLVSGRPMVVNHELEASAAFVTAWLPGSEGQGVADVIFGDFNFQGKLSFSWPGSVDDIPITENNGKTPLFPRGYGLRY